MRPNGGETRPGIVTKPYIHLAQFLCHGLTCHSLAICLRHTSMNSCARCKILFGIQPILGQTSSEAREQQAIHSGETTPAPRSAIT